MPPQMKEIGPGHFVACHLYDDEDVLNEDASNEGKEEKEEN